ncbi:MAG: 2OG-Fe(II) oxygenase [Pseudomonadota bacterium]
MTTAPWPSPRFQLDLGDHMPNIFGPDQHGGRFSIVSSKPGPFAILSIPPAETERAAPALRAFDEAVQGLGAAKPNAVVAMAGAAEVVHGQARALALRTAVLADTRGQLAEPFRALRDGQPARESGRAGIIAVVTDPDQIIRAVVEYESPDGFRAGLLAALTQCEGPGQRAEAHGFAPVLRIPRLLDAVQCQALIAAWEGSHTPGTVGLTGSYGEVVDQKAENRICYDHALREGALKAALLSTIAPRIRAAANRAFQFDIQCYGGLMVVGYPASEGGFFGAHRDNTNPAHMHRRFALTVNLNTGAYEGGGIWFPEYADQVYDPPAGDGLVFSCSVLHEARVVTRGTRFILSAFMWGAAEEQQRQRSLRDAQARRQQGVKVVS